MAKQMKKTRAETPQLGLHLPSDGGLTGKPGILPCQDIWTLKKRKVIRSTLDITADIIQPASLDLRLGAKAWRIRASFLPGKDRHVEDQIAKFSLQKLDITEGVILERGCMYVVELAEFLNLPESISAIANPKSSTGRLDILTRLISDKCEVFDYVLPGYQGKLYVEIYPQTFAVKVRTGSRLNQIRFVRRAGSQDRYQRAKLTDRELKALNKSERIVSGEATIRDGLNLSVNLTSNMKDQIIGYRATRFATVIDVDEKAKYNTSDFWEPITPRSDGTLILDPSEFYILASNETLRIPASYAAEMVAIDPMMGEFRAHYAGFFDPGFGGIEQPEARAVLEVRSDIPFVLEHGQIIARLIYEKLSEPPEKLYGEDINSNYQGQGLKLSKHFK
jgi:dCTP deaminase